MNAAVPTLRRALDADRSAIVALLAGCGLSAHAVLAPGTLYWVGCTEDAVVGVCGLEPGDGCALLRSVAVAPAQRGQGVARRLIDAALAEAARRGLHEVCLFSKDTGACFERLGWREVPVVSVARRLPRAPQVMHYEASGWYADERAFARPAAPLP